MELRLQPPMLPAAAVAVAAAAALTGTGQQQVSAGTKVPEECSLLRSQFRGLARYVE